MLQFTLQRSSKIQCNCRHGPAPKSEIERSQRRRKKAHLRHKHYKDCLNNLKTIWVKQNIIKSKGQVISTYHMHKLALTAFDTKR